MQMIDLCISCHDADALGRSHPVGASIDPVTGSLMTCTSTCHDPHAAANDALLRHEANDGLCLMCHEFG